MTEITLTATVEELAAAFDEWKRREEEDPEGFYDVHQSVSGRYGEDCAAYFIELLAEAEVKRTMSTPQEAELVALEVKADGTEQAS